MTVTHDRNRDALLRRVVEAVEAETGDAFFRVLVRGLAEALGVAYAFVSELTRGGTWFRSLALWARGREGAAFEIPLDGTPCEAVLSGQVRHYPDNLRQRFERDTALRAWNVQSYAGVPMIDSAGKVLGHFAVLDERPMSEERAAAATDVMRIFAARAVAEIERARAVEALRQSQTRLSRLIDGASDGIVSYGDDGVIVLFNRAAERILGCKAQDAVGTNVSRFGTEEGLRLVGESIEKLARDPDALIFAGGDEGVPARRADGSVFMHEASLSRSDVDGHPLYTVIFRDVEERRRVSRQMLDLRRQNDYLREELGWIYNVEEIVGRSAAVRNVVEQIERVAPTDSTVLLRGESGTGKELFARAVHARSRRSGRPLVKVNCAALSPGLVEAELFGHEKGAFTGAGERRIGRFELAQGGTIFLDEVGEIPLDVQVKLLRVLQEREIERVGGSMPIALDVRVIAATNRDLERAIVEGKFREDLFYRLSVFPVRVPPLRERPGDIPLLTRFFVERHAARIGRRITRIAPDTLERLERYAWPGNVRELENVIERAIIVARSDVLEVDAASLAGAAAVPLHAPAADSGDAARPPAETLEEAERRHIAAALDSTSWRVEGTGGAAALLGLHPSTLRSRMKKLGLAK
ncbi:MAG TPA: sigma 54-interacting transcriptional regulator [Candidatus Limnocylindrales bacterium]|nr:sigma 54-interacting transcriptional regulator [Candidatus Limnocylindrales bacterium]